MDTIEKIKLIWEKAFNIINPDVNQTFFNQGGGSLKALLFIAEVNDVFRKNLLITDVFNNPTIKLFSDFVDNEVYNLDYYPVSIIEENKIYYELSSFQFRIWALSQESNLSIAYNNTVVYEIEGELELEKFDKAFKKIIQRHESLRTIFIPVDGIPKQKILPINEVNHLLTHIDLINDVDQYEKTQLIIRKSINHIFKLESEPGNLSKLVRLNSKKFVFIFSIHHIIEDGDSLSIFFNELISYYRGKVNLPPMVEYKYFSEWHNSYLATSNQLKNQSKYWLNSLNNYEPLNLPYDYKRPLERSYDGKSISVVISKDRTLALKKIATNQNTTLFNLMFSLFNILLWKICGQSDIIVGVPASARKRKEFASTIGMFVNTLPIRNTINNKYSLTEFIHITKKNYINALANQDCPLEVIIDQLNLPFSNNRNPLFDVLFVWNEGIGNNLSDLDLCWNHIPVERTKSILDLMFLFLEEEDQIEGWVEYSTELFDSDSISRLYRCFDQIIDQVIKSNGDIEDIGKIEIISIDEKELTLVQFNNFYPKLNSDFSIKYLFEAKAKLVSEKIAVKFRQDEITYSELNSKANHLASIIESKKLNSDLIGSILEPSINLIIAIIAITKAGKTYLPLPSDNLDSTTFRLIEESKTSLIITNKHLNGLSPNVETIDISDLSLNAFLNVNSPRVISSDDPFYVVLNSEIKGKLISSVVNNSVIVNLALHYYDNTNINFDCVSQVPSLKLDASVQEIFSTLLHGGTLVIVDKFIRNNIKKVLEDIESKNVKTLFFSTSFFIKIFNQSQSTIEFPSCVEHIIVTGEKLIVSDILRKKLLKNSIYLHNHYGVFETHTVTTFTMNNESEIEVLEIGKPISNTSIFILNNQLQPQPIGIPGEIFIGGIAIKGLHFNSASSPHEKIIKNTINCLSDYQLDSILYSTGDIGKWTERGEIEYIGRSNNTIKFEGHKINLSTIINVLLEFPNVLECEVFINENESGEKYLCAYFVSNEFIDKNDLKNYCTDILPSYMVPHEFINMDSIPRFSSGKFNNNFDFNQQKGINTNTSVSSVLTPIQSKIMKFWQEIFDHNNIEIQSSFFKLGGHSLKAIQLVVLINKEFGIKIKVKDVFVLLTIEMLSNHVEFLLHEEKSEYLKNANRKKIII